MVGWLRPVLTLTVESTTGSRYKHAEPGQVHDSVDQ